MSVECNNLPGIPIKAQSCHPLIRGPADAKRVHSCALTALRTGKSARGEKHCDVDRKRQRISVKCTSVVLSRLIGNMR